MNIQGWKEVSKQYEEKKMTLQIELERAISVAREQILGSPMCADVDAGVVKIVQLEDIETELFTIKLANRYFSFIIPISFSRFESEEDNAAVIVNAIREVIPTLTKPE